MLALLAEAGCSYRRVRQWVQQSKMATWSVVMVVLTVAGGMVRGKSDELWVCFVMVTESRSWCWQGGMWWRKGAKEWCQHGGVRWRKRGAGESVSGLKKMA
ncbi:hypothetical protein M0R45_016039 [Rubus argutus]|uniref:Uncharacterized protein n=1 Tax=Rubus argutus TaxID=59490 RepID=A0AAW1XRC8_RUBAR